MNTPDIRWKQRFAAYQKALTQLQAFMDKGILSALEEQGLIKSFEYTYELAWNTLKDFYEAQGESGLQGSKDVIRLAFKRGLIAEGKIWMDMVQSRVQTSHTYNELTARNVIEAIKTKYFAAFLKLRQTLEGLQ